MSEIQSELSRPATLARDALASTQSLAADAVERIRQGASLLAAAQERARQRIERRRSQAAHRLDAWADVVRPEGEARAMVGLGRGTAALLAVGALGVGLAVGYALRAQKARNKRTGTYFTQKQHPSGHAKYGTSEEDYLAAGAGFEDLSGGQTLADQRRGRAAGPNADALLAMQEMEAMEADYRERARAGSDL